MLSPHLPFASLLSSCILLIIVDKGGSSEAVSMAREPSTNLESAMQMLIKTFHKYSGKEGDKYTLSRGELRELLTEELGNYLGNAQDKDAVERVMNDLDANNDGEVDFTEFIILMGALTVACNDFFLDSPPPKNKPEFKSDAKDGEKKE